MSDESHGLLQAVGDKQKAGALSVQWQRQMLEHLGIEMDFGCGQLSHVPHRFAADAEVMNAFQAFQQTCQSSLMAAYADDVPTGVRRFAPAESLQKNGKLSREKLLEFTTAAVEMLADDETLAMLGEAGSSQVAGALSVQWQRELLEHLGIEMDFGCGQLGLVGHRFANDSKVLAAMHAFQTSCQAAIQRALMMRAKAEARAEVAVEGAARGVDALELA